jgi:molybdopterin-containing oxidoreductase family iron-sulfur binding subunit
MSLGGVATGLLVESHEGRPTKIEGNPLHPGSLGATDVFAQAAVLGLYDPDRSQTLLNLGDIRPWSAFLGAISAALAAQRPLQGAGLRILTESVNSPTLAAQIRDLLARFPSATWHQWDPASREHARGGAKLAFGEYVDAQYRFDQADVILSLDADVLGCGPGSLRYARDFAARRRPEQADRMSRLYAIESMPSSTGARADHRLPLKPSAIAQIAREIASALDGAGRSSGASGSGAAGGADVAQAFRPAEVKFIAAVARDLQAHRGRSLVIAGDGQPAAVHALAHGINQLLGNVGKTVVYTQSVEAEPTNQLDSLRDLVADMNAGKVDLLVIAGGNPVYTAPADFRFAEALNKVQLRVHLSLYDDETSALCHWQIPEAHFLEAWSDARGYDGTVSIVQPLIAPLYGGKSAHELLAAMSDRPERSAHDIVREFWSASSGTRPQAPSAASSKPVLPPAASAAGGEPNVQGPQAALRPPGVGGQPKDPFEAEWRRWLHDGVVPDTAFAPQSTRVVESAIQSATQSAIQSAIRNPQSAMATGVEVSFRNDPSILDGRFANNWWLQELPKPITRLTWDNAVMASPATAAKLRAAESPAFQGGEH